MTTSESINDGGPAFPNMPPPDANGHGSASGYPYPDSGMSLRDWFAGQALAGLTVGCSGILGREADGSPRFSAYATGPCNAALAGRAYALADAMLAARSARVEG